MSFPTTHSIDFRGSGLEYSKIYFVNLALTIVTLGIYSAWAKVRNKRYFYGNTILAESSFDYHASPIQILKGRLLVVGVFFLYNIVVGYAPMWGVLFIIAFLVAMPWLVLKATQFNMRNSSYRQIRFDFLGDMGDLFMYYLVLPLIAMATMWLAYPFAIYKQKHYLANNTRFGQSRFEFSGTSKEFFKTYYTAVLGLILFFVLLGFLFVPNLQPFIDGFKEGMAQQQVHQLVQNAAPQEPDAEASAMVVLILMAFYGGLLFFGLIVMTYINTRITNYIYNNLNLADVRFSADIKYWKLMWIYLSNIVLIFATFGIFIPWAKVRAVKYKLSCIKVIATDLDNHIASESVNTQAVGEEMSDFLDIDVGF